jgi:serine/threonine protein kinase
MPDDEQTSPLGDSDRQRPLDPLGIIGWAIGGKYKIKSYLGGGGFGEVYEGYNENLPEQRVVIKFFKRVQAREKFAKEAKILCMLDHPNISRVIDYLPDEGAVIVSFIDGKDGAVILRESGALSDRRFLNVARAMTSAIAYAHQKKIAHRDIKPGNILIDKNENVYLIDFGIAKQTGTDATKTGYSALTPMFAAPERQTGGKDYNPFISDIYEMGITLFNFATNSLPYRNPTNPDVNEWGGLAARKLSPELTDILKKATHPDPKKRYQSAVDLRDALKNLKSPFGRRRRRSKAPWVIALIVIALAVGGYLSREAISDYVAGLTGSPENTELTKPGDIGKEMQNPDTTEGLKQSESGQNTPETAKPGGTPSSQQSTTSTSGKATSQPPKTSTTETTAKETKPAEQKPPPPPPSKSEILAQVTPSDDAVLEIGGKKRELNKRFEMEPGRYQAMVIQPDYPVLQRTVDLPSGSSDLSFDLPKEFVTLDTVDVQMALIPPSDHYILEFTRNGRKQTIANFPYLGMKLPVGEWMIDMNLRGIGPAENQPARIDSCVIYPFTAAKRSAVRGTGGILKVSRAGSPGEAARLLVYWSQD